MREMDVIEFRRRIDYPLKEKLKEKLKDILKVRGRKTTLKIIEKWIQVLVDEDPVKEDWYREIERFAQDFVDDIK